MDALNVADRRPTVSRVFGVCKEERPGGHCIEVDSDEGSLDAIVSRYIGQSLYLICSQALLGEY